MGNIISQYIEKINYNNRVILANYITGKWIRLEKEVFDVIVSILERDILLDEVQFEEKEDRVYIAELMDDLVEMDIIVQNGKEPHVYNKIASFEMTSRCNLNCIHCCVDAEQSMNEDLDLNTEEVKNILEKLVVWNPGAIMLSGGEPMLRKDFLELLSYLREIYTGNIILSTNGMFIKEENIEQLAEMINQFDISLDGVDEESCAAIRGKGVFKKIIESVSLLKEKNVTNINLSMVVGDNNEHLEHDFRVLNEKLGTRPMIRKFSAVGRGKDSKEHFTAKTGHEVYIPEAYIKVDTENCDNICCCSGGNRELFISSKGDIYPCPGYIDEDYKLGNMFDCSTVSDVVWSDKNRVLADKYRTDENVMYKNCKTCPVHIFCWSCPAAIEEIESKEAFEYQCRVIRPILLKRVWGA